MKILKSIIATFLFLTHMNAYSNTITVTNTLDSGFGSLRDAVSFSLIGDTIRFDPALIASGNNTIFLTSTITFSKNTVLKGLYNSSDTLFISGSNLISPLEFNGFDKLIMDSIVIVDGFAAGAGGGIILTNVDTITISNSIVKNCKSTTSGGGIIFNNIGVHSVIRFKNCKFSFNRSNWDGGAMVINSHLSLLKLSIINCLFDSNSSRKNGGAVFLLSRENLIATLEETKFSNNVSDQGSGGAFCFSSNNWNGLSHIKVYNSIFLNNITTFGNGGAIGLGSQGTNESLSFYSYANKFTNNSANAGGGSIHITADKNIDAECINSHFENNSANNYQGGVISCYSINDTAELRIFNSTMCSNTSNNNGGAIFITSENYTGLSIETSTISNNSSAGKGGAIFAHSSPGRCDINIMKSTIYQNKAGINSAGGIDCFSGISNLGQIKMQNTIFADNKPISYYRYNQGAITSLGYNVFSDNLLSGYLTTDLIGADSTMIMLDTLKFNGDSTKTHMPKSGSPLINRGDPSNFDEAQNGNIFDSRRDMGACERNASGYISISEKSNSLSKVFPNPFNGTFTLLTEDGLLIKQLFISDINGRVVKEITPTNNSKYLINFDAIPGLYFLNIIGVHEIKTIKLMKL
ncbi:MAG: T9SS type A sorting domain-containing protein [Flavobacteriales bacterium]